MTLDWIGPLFQVYWIV
uniref:Uncharacterized protein n=1 Tax=Arundo donax TaxID=35708 RepID=A0A0A9AJS0_ARUDO